MDRINSNNEGRNDGRNTQINSDLLAKLVAGIASPRDKALTLLMIDTGLRVREVVQLDRNSVELGNGQDSGGSGLNSGAGKTQNGVSIPGRRFYFTARTADALTAYLMERGDDASAALFINKDGTRLKSHAIVRMMYRCCDVIGIERIGPHHLRRFFAFAFMNGGGSPMMLMQLLGHSNVQSTVRLYPRLDLQVN
jgi:integrase